MSAGANAAIYVPLEHLLPALKAAAGLAKLPGKAQEPTCELILPNGTAFTSPFHISRWFSSAPVETTNTLEMDGDSVSMQFELWAPRPEDSDWMELDRIKVNGVRCFRFPASLYLQAGREFARVSISVDGRAETTVFAHESTLVRLGGISHAGNAVGAHVNIDGGMSLRDSDFDFVTETDFLPYNVRSIDEQAKMIAKLLAES